MQNFLRSISGDTTIYLNFWPGVAKKKQVPYSSLGVDILVAADAEDRVYGIELSHDYVFLKGK